MSDHTTRREDKLAALIAGWEARDSDGEEPCSIERGTTRDGNLDVLAEGLTYQQSERIEDFLASLPAALDIIRATRALLDALMDSYAAADLTSWDAPYLIPTSDFKAQEDTLRAALAAWDGKDETT